MANEAIKANDISFRPAQPGDRDFAARPYIESRRTLLTALGRWDEGRVMARFKQAFKPKQTQIIRSNGMDIGWMHVSRGIDGFHLHQLYIVDDYRNRGIGSALIQTLQGRAQKTGQPVVLNVIKGSPAIALYRRFGFRTVGEDEERLHMRWEPEGPPER